MYSRFLFADRGTDDFSSGKNDDASYYMANNWNANVVDIYIFLLEAIIFLKPVLRNVGIYGMAAIM